MELKMTNVARQELDRLAPETRSRVIGGLRSLTTSWQRDKVLQLSGIEDDVRVHNLGGPLRALYRLTDLDDDGDNDIVVLQILDKRLTEPILEVRPSVVQRSTDSVRLGSQLASQIVAAD